MTPLREKDRLFLVVAVPIAVLAAYVVLWRVPHAKKVESYRQRCAALVDPEDFQTEKARLQKRVEESAAELEEERKSPPPESTMKGSSSDTVAVRERAVLEVFREAGLRVVSSEAGRAGPPDGGGSPASSAPSRGESVLKATALRPEPRSRRYVLDGGYAAVMRALAMLADRKCAVIPERLAMGDGERWTLFVWL